jgi:hypothetical protein
MELDQERTWAREGARAGSRARDGSSRFEGDGKPHEWEFCSLLDGGSLLAILNWYLLAIPGWYLSRATTYACSTTSGISQRNPRPLLKSAREEIPRLLASLLVLDGGSLLTSRHNLDGSSRFEP